MITPQRLSATASSDAARVREFLAGDRAAFARIVAQYQSLVCSLAYSATGSLRRSEELAQETFLVAWRKLPELREAEKLRPWLCGIARNLIGTALRRQGREPTHGAAPLEQAAAVPAPGASPLEEAVSGEEEAILWRSLEQIPEIYREPLILFYRESESTERVAEILDLTPDTARQRLSRGRKLLQEEVTAFVEGALRRSAPGGPFTAGVLAVMPTAGFSAAAALGAASAKGAGMAKAAALFGWPKVLAGPFLSVAGGYLGYRMSLDQAQSEEERHFIRKSSRRIFLCILGSWIVLVPLTVIWGEAMVRRHPWALFLLLNGSLLALLGLMRSTKASVERNHGVFTAARAARVRAGAAPVPSGGFSYRSPVVFLGLPLVNIRLTHDLAASQEPVRGWVAIGGVAIGGLFAFGGMAVAPISVGGLAIGGIAVGGCALGLVAAGGFAAGIWAFGGMAEGWQAAGGLVLGWKAAIGGLGWAHDFAVGGMVHALHTNDAAARDFVEHQLFYRNPKTAKALLWWGPAVVWLPPLLVMAWMHRRNRRLRPLRTA